MEYRSDAILQKINQTYIGCINEHKKVKTIIVSVISFYGRLQILILKTTNSINKLLNNNNN